MKTKTKTCSGCGEDKVIWKNHEGKKYCQYCWNSIKFKKEGFKPKKQKPINPRSKKRIILDQSYSKLRKIFLEQKPMCEATLHCCTQKSTDVHHKKGRGKWYLVTSTWMSVCRSCHQWIETHPIEATEMGFRESKITE